MSLVTFLVLFLAINVLMLLASPIYHNQNKIFLWYYKNIFQKVFKNQAYKHIITWIVPFFYCLLILSFGFIYYLKLATTQNNKLSLINLTSFENYFFIPFLIISNVSLVFMCYKKSFKNISNKANFTKVNKYDNILYHPSTFCQTCQLVKPARSKHCSLCQKCIPDLDHHCIWINGCVSQSNIMLFDCLLLNNLFSLFYVSARSGLILKSLNAKFSGYYKNATNNQSDMVLTFKIVRKNLLTIFLLGFCFLMVMSWFVYTQIKLIIDGMTSNESDKWFVIHSLIYDGYIYKINEKYFIITEESKNDCSLKKFNSVNFYDNKIYTFDRVLQENRVESPEEIVNIYDKGSFIKNLKERWSL